MAQNATKMTPDKNGGDSDMLDRLFSQLERFSYNYSVGVVVVAVVLAAVCVWFTAQHLTFNTSRRDLISKNLGYEKFYQRYKDAFEDFSGVTVVVEGDQPEAMKNFTESLVQRLRQNAPLYSEILYKIDVDYFRNKGLLYMDLPEIKELAGKLESHRNFLEDLNAAPGLNQLLRGINSKISSGMVDSLLSDFLGTGSDDEGNEKDDTADLALLTSILKQMNAFVDGGTEYHSPWRSFLANDGGKQLEEEGYFVSDDGSLMYIIMNPDDDAQDFAGSRNAIESLRNLIKEVKKDHPGVQVGVTGGDVIASDEMVTTQIDVRDASLIALTGVTLLFIFAYGGVVKPLLAVFSLLVALCWSLGYTTFAVGHLNILSVVFTTILIGLGIDFGIHVLERFREERAAGKELLPALERTLQCTGRGNLAGAITTAIAFGSMMFTDFIGMAELGEIAAGGILLCLVAMVLLLPSLITLEEKWRGDGRRPSLASAASGSDRLEKFFDHYLWIIGICLFAIAVSALAFLNLRFDYNLLNLQAHGSEAVQYELKILENDKRSTWHAALIADSLEDAQRKQKIAESLPTVGKVESILSAIPNNQDEKIKTIKTLAPILNFMDVEPVNEPVTIVPLTATLKKIRFKLQERKGDENAEVSLAGNLAQSLIQKLKTADPDQSRERLQTLSGKLFADYRDKLADLKAGGRPTPVLIEELPDLLKRRFLGKNGKFLIQVYPNINIWEREAMEAFLRDVRRIDPMATGNAVHMYETSQLMKMGYLRGGLYAMVAIVFFLLVSFKNLRTTLFIMLPTVVGAIWTVGLMHIMNVQFNLANLVILPLIIGIGVVNGIHIVHRYREENEKGVSVLSRSTGQAVALSSLTTMIGFGSLMVADHQGIYSLGLVLTLGVGNALIASITLLPALLKMCAVNGWKV